MKKESATVETELTPVDSVFPNTLSEFVYYRTYSRWQQSAGRRETWEETVARVIGFYKDLAGKKLDDEDWELLHEYIYNFYAMPSMRLMWTAGPALKKNHFGAFNCSFVNINHYSVFSEIMYVLMHGTGVGYSVEQKNIAKVPAIKPFNGNTETLIVGDSKEGWAGAMMEACELWWKGNKVEFDLSKIRKKGTVLKTFGGRASGPGPLKECFDFFADMIERHRGRTLSPINCHDLACKIAESIVVGGVRRSAMISLSDLYDQGMRHAKDGQFWIKAPMRSMSNNSAVYDHKPNSTVFMEEWLALAKSGSGERGIFNRSAIKGMLPKRRSYKDDFGTNPCAEIILRDHGLCNLSEVVLRDTDNFDSVLKKVKVATILGTLQSMLTDFGDLVSDKWAKNQEQERLLGVSITGQMDNPALLTEENLEAWKDYAIGINVEYSKKLGIGRSKAITCTKPSGTCSQLVDSASGFHPRFAKHYIRRVRISSTDPLYKMMKDQGVRFFPEVGQIEGKADTYVCEFPIKAPHNSVTAQDMTAIEQLEQWLKIKSNWAEHTVSATIYVEPDEWLKVGNWVYENFEDISGISFLPKNDHVYQLAPYEKIDEDTYNKMASEEVTIDYGQLSNYESEDYTEGAKSYACTGSSCELT